MRKLIAFFLLALWMLVPVSSSAAVVYRHNRHYRRTYYSPSYARHRRHVRTLKRVGVGAGGGALVGALAGGGKGAGIGAVAGGATGYIYDRYKRHHRE
ncbi:MAG TPA: YMGG-like glycine zipper-containing protein [Bryobacteraceae bacterium]|nr:YMGG-like glycine zipper-containing protein [Bryobacteraceae bacterium]